MKMGFGLVAFIKDERPVPASLEGTSHYMKMGFGLVAFIKDERSVPAGPQVGTSLLLDKISMGNICN